LLFNEIARSALKSHGQRWNRTVSAEIARSAPKLHGQRWNRTVSAEIARSALKSHQCRRSSKAFRTRACDLQWQQSPFFLRPARVLLQTRVARFFLTHDSKIGRNIPQYHKIYHSTTKYTKLPQNIPEGSKIRQNVIKNTNIFHCKTLQNLPNLGFLVWKYTIWQHRSRHSVGINRVWDVVYLNNLTT
jgi:hypothetical protein